MDSDYLQGSSIKGEGKTSTAAHTIETETLVSEI